MVAVVGRVNVGGSESTESWRWSIGRLFGEPLVVANEVGAGAGPVPEPEPELEAEPWPELKMPEEPDAALRQQISDA